MNLKTHNAYAEIVPQADCTKKLTVYGREGETLHTSEHGSVELACQARDKLAPQYVKTKEG